MTINLSIRNYSITVASLDCKRALKSFQGHDSNLDQSGLIIFTGSIVLGRPQGFESLDDRRNNRWSRGQEIVTTIADKSGTLQPPPRGGKLYILDSQFDLKSRVLTLNVGDLFELLKIKEPKGDASKVCLGTASSRQSVINNLLTAAGVPPTADPIPGALLSAAPRLIEGSYIEQAGAIAASVGYFLWIDSTGATRASKLDAAPTVPVFLLDLMTGMVDYERLAGEQPAERVTVDGKATVIKPAGDETTTYSEEFGSAAIAGSNSDDEILIKTTFTEDKFSRGSKTRTITTTEQQPAGIVLPDDANYKGSTQLVLSEHKIETYQYEANAPITGLSGQTACQAGNQGRLKTHTVESYKPRAAVFREIYSTYPDDITFDRFGQVLSSKEITTYVYDPGSAVLISGDTSALQDPDIPMLETLGGLRINRVQTQLLGTIIPSDYAYDPDRTRSNMELPVTTESEIQVWREINSGEWKYEQTIYKSLALAYPQVADTIRDRRDDGTGTFDPAVLARLVEVAGNITRSNSGQAQPPAADTYPPPFSTQDLTIKGRANFPVDNTSAFRARDKTISFEYLSSATYGRGAVGIVKDQADALAKTWGVVFWGQHKGSQYTTDLQDNWFTYTPLCRVDVNEPEGVSANLADGFSIAIAEKRCAVNFNGVLLGFASVATPSIVAPLYRLSDIGEMAGGSAIKTIEVLFYSALSRAESSQGAIGGAIQSIEVIVTFEPIVETGLLAGGSAINRVEPGLASTFSYRSGTVTPIGTSGLTQIVGTAQDDANIAIGDIGFDFPLYDGTYRSNIYIGSNSYLTFGFGSNVYGGFSITSPGRALQVNASDRSWRTVWVGSDSSDTYRVRWEGFSSSNTGVAADSFWEVTLFSDGAIMLVTNTSSVFQGGKNTLTKGDGIAYTNYTYNRNSSIVFIPDGNGSYTVQTGSYSSGGAINGGANTAISSTGEIVTASNGETVTTTG